MMLRVIHMLLLIFIFVVSSSTNAQPLSKEKDLKPLSLPLKPDSDDKEILVAAAEGAATEKGDLLLFSGQDMFQPMIIMVFASDKEKPLQVSLHKDSWDENEMNAVTDQSEGYCEFKIRSAGEVGVRIKGESSAYIVMAMAGKEIMPKMESPFTKKGKEKASSEENIATKKDLSNSSPSILMIAILTLVAILIILVALRLFSKKNKNIGILIIGALSILPTQAQHSIKGGTVEEIRRETERILETQGEKSRERIGKVQEKTEKAYKLLKGGKELWEAYKNLGSCMNTAIPPGMPSIPSYCYKGDDDETGEGPCAKCFEDARSKFNEVRYKFIKLGIIYRCTKSFADKSIAFGDDVSSIHAVQGLAWQAEKRKIEESVERLKKSYDDKYIELLQRLHESMMDLNDCEEEFGERNWYDRFGFMFYEFMKEKYRRID